MVNIIGNFVIPGTGAYFVLAVVGNPAFVSVLGAHLLFRMKEEGEKGFGGGTRDGGSRSGESYIDFAVHPPTAASQISDDTAGFEAHELERIR